MFPVQTDVTFTPLHLMANCGQPQGAYGADSEHWYSHIWLNGSCVSLALISKRFRNITTGTFNEHTLQQLLKDGPVPQREHFTTTGAGFQRLDAHPNSCISQHCTGFIHSWSINWQTRAGMPYLYTNSQRPVIQYSVALKSITLYYKTIQR